MIDFLRQLTVMTVYRPAEAAQLIVGRTMSRETAWSIVALAVILNTLAYFVSITLFPIPPEFAMPLLTSPVLVCMVLGSVVTIFVFAFFWVGRTMGGQATFTDILLMMAWLQFMRLIVQVIALVLMVFLPGLSQLFVMAAGIYGGWIVVNFLNVAHQLESLGKSLMLLIFTLMGMTFGMVVFLSFIGVTAIGIS